MKRISNIFITMLLVTGCYLFLPSSSQAQQATSAKATSKAQKSTLIYLNDFSQIAEKFDADSGDVRLVSLLSPT